MNHTDINVKQIAHLVGQNPATISRLAKAGRFGAPHLAPGSKRKLFALPAVEAHFRTTFSADQIAAARGAKPIYAGPKAKAVAADKRSRSNADNILELCRLFIKLNDRLWIEKLAKRGITDISPPATMAQLR